MNRVVIYPTIIFLALSCAGCVNREAQKQAHQTRAIITDRTVEVAVQPVQVKNVTESLEITGSIVTASDATIGAQVGGRIVSVFVQDGDQVTAGQVIAQQETTDLTSRVRQAQAIADAARAQLQQAEEDARVGPLRSAAAVRASKARVAQLEATLKKLKSGDRPEERRRVAAAVEAAKTNMETAQKELERVRTLVREGAIAKQQQDQAENALAAATNQYQQALETQRIQQSGARQEDLAAAEQQLEAAREQLRSDQAAQQLDVQYRLRVNAARSNLESANESLALARKALGDASIRSPFSGRISGKPVQPGTYVAPGVPVARVVSSEGLYFEGEAPEGQIALLTPSKPVDIKINALPNKKFTGSILAVSPVGSDIGRIFKVRIKISTVDPAIRPGMFASGSVNLQTVPNAILVPTSAIISDGSERHVYIVEGDVAKRIKVTLGLTQDVYTQVIGLTPQAKVVVKGQAALRDGMKIRVETPEEVAEQQMADEARS